MTKSIELVSGSATIRLTILTDELADLSEMRAPDDVLRVYSAVLAKLVLVEDEERIEEELWYLDFLRQMKAFLPLLAKGQPDLEGNALSLHVFPYASELKIVFHSEVVVVSHEGVDWIRFFFPRNEFLTFISEIATDVERYSEALTFIENCLAAPSS